MADDVTQRMNYFDHQFLRVDDFSQEQSYHLDRRRRHNRLLHVWGIAEGLGLTAPNGAAGVTVQPGTAIDGAGREIVLTTVSSAVDLSGHAGKVVYVTIAYDEAQTDPKSDAGTMGYSRWTETPKIEISETPPAQQDHQLVLGRVTLDNNSRSTGKTDDGDGQNQRRLVGVIAGDLRANSVTLTNPELSLDTSPRFQADRNGFVQASGPFGPLTVRGNLAVEKDVGIGTLDAPKARLEVAGDVLVSGDSNVTMGRALLTMGRGQGQRGEVTAAIAFLGWNSVNAQISWRPGSETQSPGAFELVYRGGQVPDLTYDPATAVFANLTLRSLIATEASNFGRDLTVEGPTTLAGLTGNEPATFKKDLSVTGVTVLGGSTALDKLPLDVGGGGRMRVRSGTNGSAGVYLNQKGTADSQPALDRAFVGMNDYNTVGFWSSVSGIGWCLLTDITTGKVRIGPEPVDDKIRTEWGSASATKNSLYVAGDFYVGGKNAARAGNTTSWTVLSDRALKTNIKAVDGALDTLTRLRGVTFEWKQPENHGDQAGPVLGLIAQEVEEVFPDWVSSSPAGTKLLTMQGFEALTIEACKELKLQLETERARNEDLETRIRALEQQVAAR